MMSHKQLDETPIFASEEQVVKQLTGHNTWLVNCTQLDESWSVKAYLISLAMEKYKYQKHKYKKS